jgi:SAM-dependent methyltransferase
MRRWGLLVSLLSMASMGYELLLLRLFSIIYPYHLAFLIISLALLGIGAGGAFLTLTRGWLIQHFPLSFSLSAVGFGLGVVFCFLVTREIPFYPHELAWNPSLAFRLTGIYVILSVPFFFSGTGIGLALTRFAGESHRIYLFDLIGAGVGAMGTVLLMEVLTPQGALRFMSAIGLLAGAIGLWDSGKGRLRLSASVSLLFIPAVLLLLPAHWLEPRPSQFKALSLLLRHPDARILAQRWGPMGWVAVADNPRAPLRYAPGMSLTCTGEPPRQVGIYLDGDLVGPITRFQGHADSLGFLACQTASLPFHLLNGPEVLVLGAGGGTEVLRALYYGADSIDAVEENPDIVKMIRGRFGEFSGKIYETDKVRVYAEATRTFLARTSRSFDLIQISLDTAGQRAAFRPSYELTEEALKACLLHLRPGGLFSVTQWAQLPPRDSLRLFLTALNSLEDEGIERPGEHLALIRSFRTTTLLVGRDPFGSLQLREIRQFCARMAFDPVHIPGMRPEEANQYNRLRNPSFFLGARALLGKDRETFLRDYKFLIRPVTDQRPFFYHFFRLRTLPEVLSLMRRGGISLLEWGYPLLFAALLVAAASGAALILLPLAFIRKAENPSNNVRSCAVAGFFFSLGMGFMFLEMAFFHRLTLYLGHPVLSASVVISAFLISAGAGSGWSQKWHRLCAGRQIRPFAMDIPAAAVGIAVWSLLLIAGLPHLFEWSLGFPLPLRTLLAVLVIAPLGFFMGMPFPLGLERLAALSVNHIPWAWGINGCASVLSTILASILALELGFNGVILLAVFTYGAAAGWSVLLTK